MLDGDVRFHWADYTVFAASLLLSTGVGIYFAYAARRKTSTEEFLMAGRKMSPILVGFSIFVSWMSATSVLSDPVQAYTFGAIYWIIGFGHSLGIPVVAHFFAPYFQELKIVSAYQVLEMKYNKGLRLIATSVSIVSILLYLGIVSYGPSLALSQFSGIPVWTAMVCIALVCMFYTAIGGMKAVLWTDALQMLIMLAGQLAVVIQGCLRVGGVNQLFSIISETGHNKITNFDPNPLTPMTFWAFLFGGMFRVIVPYISAQMIVQRYCTVKTKKDAKTAVYITIPMYILMATLFTATGFVMAAVYHGCDPLRQGRIQHKDQMVPLLVLDLLGFIPGVPGLFMAAVFSASLSTLSSGINSMSANTLKDFIEPAVLHFKKKQLNDRTGTIIAKLLVIVFGSAILGLAFVMMATGGNIFALTVRIIGMVSSPVAGMFFMAVFLPKVKAKSVTLGFLITMVVMLWIGIGAFSLPRSIPPQALPVSTEFCDVINGTAYNTSDITMTTITSHNTSDITMTTMTSMTTDMLQAEMDSQKSSFLVIYYLEPLYYTVIGSLGVVILSLIFHGIGCCWDRLHRKGKVHALNGDQENKRDKVAELNCVCREIKWVH